ncbi:phosphatase inhibitor-domain-containing protein [Panaeolus papilionaceus]|nr:phosphatase inhibitor-domain-containing protein [Panaeolus papilionaceus]
MRSALAHRNPRAPNASDGSRTITITPRDTEEIGEGAGPSGSGETAQGAIVGTIRVKATKKKPGNGQRVAWDEGVVDNEGCGRKKSKICCIYHKPRAFDESSSEESDSSDDDSDASYSGARPSSGYSRRNQPHSHDHAHPHAPSSSSSSAVPSASSTTVIHTPSETQYEPNAYERQPKGKKKA